MRFCRPRPAWPRVTFACQREVDGISRQTIFRKSAILSPTTRIAEGDFRVPKGGCRHQPKNGFPKECDSCVTASRICTRMMPLPNNDGVHRVAAGGCSKNRKPAGRNSGATLCYCGVDSCIIVRFTLTIMPFTIRSHQTNRLTQSETAIQPAFAGQVVPNR